MAMAMSERGTLGGALMGMAVKIDYTNWRGERSVRRVQPVEIKFVSNEWHPIAQWLLVAIDLDDGNYQEKGFALKNIHSWEPA